MRARLVTAAFRGGWALLPHVPAPVTAVAFALAADLTWARRGAGVRQLEANLARAAPASDAAGRRRLARTALRSYLRYWADLFTMAHWSREELRARTRVQGLEPLASALERGSGAVGFLGHLGSWDQIGAWAAAELAPVTTVAERLEPEALHEAFVTERARLGIAVVPLTGAGSFGHLVRTLRAGGFVPLLGDRDLSGSGVPVQLLGQGAHAAAGPASLALATGAPLFPITVVTERLPGQRAGRRWGIATTVHPPVPVPAAQGVGGRRGQVAAMTQACVDVVSAAVRAAPADWHVMQPVFDADLARPTGPPDHRPDDRPGQRAPG